MLASAETTHSEARRSTIRPVRKEDMSPLMKLIKELGLFPAAELNEVGALLADYLEGNGAGDQHWITDDDQGLVGVAYYAPERMSEGTWNLYLIGVRPDNRGEGRGAALVTYVEEELVSRGERILLVETSGLPGFDPARLFYLKCRFEVEARIRDFYKAGEDKIIFRKVLASRTGRSAG